MATDMDVAAKPTRTFRNGRYLELSLIGVGAESEVILALDLIEDRQVILKWQRMSNRVPDGDDPILDTFRRLSTLAHPGLGTDVDCYYEPALGSWVLVETSVKARDLAKLAPELDADELDDVFLDLVHILDHLHAAGLRHGDLKPQNVILARRGGLRRARIIDFGMTRAAADPWFPGGTPSYLPPEIALQGPSEQMDWYALGVMLRDLRSPERANDRLSQLRDACLEPDPAARRESLSEWKRPYRAGRDYEFTLSLSAIRQKKADLLARVLRSALDENHPANFISLSGGVGTKRELLIRRLAFELRRNERAVVSLSGPFSSGRLRELAGTACGRRLSSLRQSEETDATDFGGATRSSILGFLKEVRADRTLFILLEPEAAESKAAAELALSLRSFRRAATGLETAKVVLVATDELKMAADHQIPLPTFDGEELSELVLEQASIFTLGA